MLFDPFERAVRTSQKKLGGAGKTRSVGNGVWKEQSRRGEDESKGEKNLRSSEHLVIPLWRNDICVSRRNTLTNA